MKFDKLRLLGFKSFVEPSEFIIENGLTGIVGPNGCGKSNLVEALRWVMGENSYKNMRASEMDDVIFSGSGNRPARNTAEVALFLDNTDRSAPAAFNDSDELQVSRRIERESGSVYRINGKDVRAKDVQLLFADASTGARSPSMVGQGRIGELISAKPQARRALLEEAAGISGLHSRRHEAELRLRASEQNLERLEDVVAQLETQLDSLKRQARQANRYRNLSGVIKQTEALLFHLKWVAAKEVEGQAQSTLADLNSQMADKAAANSELSRKETDISEKLPGLREAEAASAAALQRIQIARSQVDDELARLEERKTELESRLGQTTDDLQREEQLISDNRETLENLDREEAELNAKSANLSEIEEKSRLELEEATEKLGSAEAEFSDLTVKIANENARRKQLENLLQDCAERLSRQETQKAKIAEDTREVEDELSGLTGVETGRENITHCEQALATAESALVASERDTQAARKAEEEARQPLEAAERKLSELETEARTLRKILNRKGQDLFPAVVEQISVEPGYEAALGAALGEDLEAPLEPSSPVHWTMSSNPESDPELPAGTKPLASVVQAPRELSRRLAQVGVVDRNQAASVIGHLKPGQRLVSIQGDLWRWDGYVAGADAPTTAAQKLAQKNRLSELENLESEARSEVERSRNQYDGCKDETAGKIEAELACKDKLGEVRRELNEARESLAGIERASSGLIARKSALQEAFERIVSEHEDTRTKSVETEAMIAGLPDMSLLQAELELLRVRVAEDRAGLAEVRAASQGLAQEAEARGRRIELIAKERSDWIARLANAEKRTELLSTRKTEISAELDRLNTAPEEIEKKRVLLIDEVEQAEAKRKSAADLLAETENAQREADRAAREAAETLANAREACGRAEERLNASVERRQEIEQRIREELECGPADVFGMTGLKPDAQLPEVEKTESKLERQKAERERLGAVNLRAEIEQNEISEKREELVREREDLLAAIAKLRSGIQSLNKEGRERLLEAFEVVNTEFTRLFTHLFGGGTAELQLVESDDPLEAGLEILARPPGKKPQTMTLLSGGEQALTALALIFAVFLTNPAPICVLDEVDAPLDDHNVERFCNLMDEMVETTDTKFVLITHNPITMARVNRLFGVTMAERGVSQLVSVDLQEAEKLVEAV